MAKLRQPDSWVTSKSRLVIPAEGIDVTKDTIWLISYAEVCGGIAQVKSRRKLVNRPIVAATKP